MYDNYIFDLYGTLVDIRTNENKASLWKYMARYMTLQGAAYSPSELRKRYRDLIHSLRMEQYEKNKPKYSDLTPEEIEVDLSEVFRRLYTEKDVTPDSRMLADWALMYRTISLDYVRLYDGAGELLEELHRQKKKVFLLSNAQRLFTEPGLRSLGIYSLFDDVLISSEIGFMKPSPLFYGTLIKKHGLDPRRCVMVGNDWQADAWGAYDNGLSCMYVHTAQSPELKGELPPGCIRLDNISEVLPEHPVTAPASSSAG